MVFFSKKNRPFHLSPYPLERLSKDKSIIAIEHAAARNEKPAKMQRVDTQYAEALSTYHEVFKNFCEGESAPAKAPVPDDLERRMIDIKGAGFFLDASQIGICEISDACWYAGAVAKPHTHAIVVLAKYSRLPESDNLAHNWLKRSLHQTAEMRAFEVAIGIANHIRMMGFNAVGYDDENEEVDVDRLTVLSGLGVRQGDKVVNPYLGSDYAIALITTDYPLQTDLPLASSASDGKGLAYWLGIGGATSGLERLNAWINPQL